MYVYKNYNALNIITIIIIIIIIIMFSVVAHSAVNPCMNGGLPLSSRFGYHCLCSKDYHGRFCDGM